MAWFEGTEERDYVIAAPIDVVVDFFADPGTFKTCYAQLESAEQVDDDTWEWTLEEMSQLGVTYQGHYTAQYTRDGNDEVTWETVSDTNMRSNGCAQFEAVGDSETRVQYRETIGSDIEVNRLIAKAIKGVVSREIAKGVGRFLDCAKKTLETEAS